MLTSISFQDKTQNLMASNAGKGKSAHAEEMLRKAKSLYYQKSKNGNNFKVDNLINMAETAIKNGNASAAENFANKAIDFFNRDDKKDVNFDILKDAARFKKESPGEKPKEHSSHSYKDASNDPGVSFAYASSLSGPESFLAVPAHEAEHVGRAVGEAQMKGERVEVYVSYSVRYDPATGEAYMAGGLTTVVRHPKVRQHIEPKIGKHVDMLA